MAECLVEKTSPAMKSGSPTQQPLVMLYSRLLQLSWKVKTLFQGVIYCKKRLLFLDKGQEAENLNKE